MLLRLLNPNFEHTDERGTLIQLVREGQKQVNYIFSRAGEIRGNHYHKLNTETFYIINGQFRLKLELGNESETYTFSGGEMFQVLPGVRHTFEYLSNTQLIGLYDIGIELPNGQLDMYN